MIVLRRKNVQLEPTFLYKMLIVRTHQLFKVVFVVLCLEVPYLIADVENFTLRRIY